MAAALFAAPAAVAPAAGAATGVAPAREFAPRQVVVKFEGQRFGHAVGLPPRVGVREATAALRKSPHVAYAEPNYIATASAASVGSIPFVPNDPGRLVDPAGPGGWVDEQWNFLPWEGGDTARLPISPGGIDAPGAWENLIAVGHPGAEGVTVAVLDTGIAYRDDGTKFLRSPDFSADQFTGGYDFIANDRLPLDRNGHGTHVAGTIAEETDNAIGLTGLAYGAKLMPVRVLNRHGEGLANRIAKGIRFAVSHGADVINMSFNFDCHQKVPVVDEALQRAYEKGVVTVASVGNRESEHCVSAPATAPHVIGVGGTTEGACLGKYSLAGKGVDVVAPGGGVPKRRLPIRFRPSDLPGDSHTPQHQALRRAWGIRRDLDGGGARLGHGGNDPRGRDRPEDDASKTGQGGDAETQANRPQHRAAEDAAGRRADRRQQSDGVGRLGRADDDHAAGSVMGDVVGDAAEEEAAGAGHPLVADDDQVGVGFLGHVEDRVGGVALDRVCLDLDPLLLGGGGGGVEDEVDVLAGADLVLDVGRERPAAPLPGGVWRPARRR